jgi:hypothetical protein
VRPSSSFARACSGDMYATVPSVLPGLVRYPGSTSYVASVSDSEIPFARLTLANPKSKIFACPRFVTKIFPGLMSR